LASGWFWQFSQKKQQQFSVALAPPPIALESCSTASLVDCTRKKFLPGGCRFVVSDVISGGLLGHLGPLCLALGANRLVVVFR